MTETTTHVAADDPSTETAIEPAPIEDMICKYHGTRQRLGAAPGEWFCGSGFGMEFEGPCNEETPDERKVGEARWRAIMGNGRVR